MNKYILLFIILIISHLTFGQTKSFSIKKISYKTFSFPIISGGDSVAADRVNMLLQLGELALIKGHEQHDIFEVISVNNHSSNGGKTNICYTILENNGRTFSVQFDEAAVDMTVHYWQSDFTFNSANGSLIHLQDLFTPVGYKKFKTLAFAKQTAEYKQELKANKYSDSVIDYLPKGFKGMDYTDFYIKNGSIFINARGLLSKIDFVSSNLNLVTRIKYKEFNTLLNDYGRAVFTDSASLNQYYSHSMPQLMTGTIDKYLIVMLLKYAYNTRAVGLYAYLKNGVGIDLDGKINKGHFMLIEKDQKQNKVADIDLIIKNDTATGTWKGLNGKTYKLNLSFPTN